MVNKYYLTNKAKSDLEHIFNYIAIDLQNTEAALSLISHFERKFNNLLQFPEAYPVIESVILDLRDIRKCIMNKYLIAYRINHTNKSVEIIRVIYQRENYL